MDRWADRVKEECSMGQRETERKRGSSSCIRDDFLLVGGFYFRLALVC